MVQKLAALWNDTRIGIKFKHNLMLELINLWPRQ